MWLTASVCRLTYIIVSNEYNIVFSETNRYKFYYLVRAVYWSFVEVSCCPVHSSIRRMPPLHNDWQCSSYKVRVGVVILDSAYTLASKRLAN